MKQKQNYKKPSVKPHRGKNSARTHKPSNKPEKRPVEPAIASKQENNDDAVKERRILRVNDVKRIREVLAKAIILVDFISAHDLKEDLKEIERLFF